MLEPASSDLLKQILISLDVDNDEAIQALIAYMPSKLIQDFETVSTEFIHGYITGLLFHITNMNRMHEAKMYANIKAASQIGATINTVMYVAASKLAAPDFNLRECQNKFRQLIEAKDESKLIVGN